MFAAGEVVPGVTWPLGDVLVTTGPLNGGRQTDEVESR